LPYSTIKFVTKLAIKLAIKLAFKMDIKYLAPNQPSLCIPRVFMNINEARIRNVLDQVSLGRIDRIDILVRKSEKGEEYKRVFVHFAEWYWNKDAQTARSKLISGKEIKLVYDDPWFWKVSASNWEPKSAVKPMVARPHIDFEEDRRTEKRRPEQRKYGEQRRYEQERRYEEQQRRPEQRQYEERRRYDERRPEQRQYEERRRFDERRPEERRRYDERRSEPQAIPVMPIAPALPAKPQQIEGVVNITYGIASPVKKRVLKPKTKKPEATTTKQIVELEEGELLEVCGTVVTQEELKDMENLYGDL
jgi:hypothetical protein